MKNIERKKLVTIIAIIATMIVAGLAILLSVLAGESTKPEETNTPTPAPTNSATSTTENLNPPVIDGIQQGAEVVDPDAEGAPPADAYANDFTEDDGYQPLGKNFDPKTSDTTNTVYNEGWSVLKYNEIICELSNKKTSTLAVRQPLLNYSKDIGLIGGDDISSRLNNINSIIEYLESIDGERIPATQSSFYSIHCAIEEQNGHEH